LYGLGVILPVAEVSVIVTTTAGIDGYQVADYLGVVSGEAILGANVFKDWMAGFRNFFGGRTRGYERELAKARQDALEKMVERAAGSDASAVIGISLDYEFIGMGRGGMMMVVATGTAVRLERVRESNTWAGVGSETSPLRTAKRWRE
jgi:uncharacterized protein YbjQ (UPF0145 family)